MYLELSELENDDAGLKGEKEKEKLGML